MEIIEEMIVSIISRCKTSTIKETLLQWGRLNSIQLNRKTFLGTKKKILDNVIKLVEDSNLNEEIIGDLELVYMQLHSRKKEWKVYKLSGQDSHVHMDPRSLRAKIQQNLQLEGKIYQVFGNMNMFGGGIWLRMHLGIDHTKKTTKSKGRSYNYNNSLFVVTFSGSPYFILSKAGAKHMQLMTNAIIKATKADSLVDIQLSGRHIASLADIVLKKNGQLQSSTFRKIEEKENPFTENHTRKRKASEETTDVENIIDEDRLEKRRRSDNLCKLMGSDPQPVLEKLEYKMNIKFHGKPLMDAICKTTIEVKGKSVLDGIYQLAKAGVLKFPLPAHLTSVATSSQRNSFTIQARNK